MTHKLEILSFHKLTLLTTQGLNILFQECLGLSYAIEV